MLSAAQPLNAPAEPFGLAEHILNLLLQVALSHRSTLPAFDRTVLGLTDIGYGQGRGGGSVGDGGVLQDHGCPSRGQLALESLPTLRWIC